MLAYAPHNLPPVTVQKLLPEHAQAIASAAMAAVLLKNPNIYKNMEDTSHIPEIPVMATRGQHGDSHYHPPAGRIGVIGNEPEYRHLRD